MIIEIIDQPDDGDFTVGNCYEVVSKHYDFVYAFDNNSDIEAVYKYQFKII